MVKSIKKIGIFGLGSVAALIPWIVLYSGYALHGDTWERLGKFFANPYSSAGYSILGNIKVNLGTFLFTGTLLYMMVIAGCAVVAAYRNTEWRLRNRTLLLFTLLYSPFALFYYLKSLGNLRYLIATQFLLLLLIVPVLVALTEHMPPGIKKGILVTSIGALFAFQSVYLFTAAKLFYSDEVQTAISYVSSRYPNATFGVINLPTIASLLPADKTYNLISTYDLKVGVNFMELPPAKMPEIVFVNNDDDPLLTTRFASSYAPLEENPTPRIKIFRLRK